MELARLTTTTPFALSLAFVAACGAPESQDPAGEMEGEMEATGAAAEAGTAQEVVLPDTTVEAVWSYLQSVDYAASWPMWPGKTALYTGGEPHGMLLTTYVNAPAMEALRAGAGTMPVGAIIVKENYTAADSTLAATTVMYKTESFNPDHANWWFLKRNADGSVDAGGRGAGCESCHGAGPGAENDYILTDDFSRPVTGDAGN